MPRTSTRRTLPTERLGNARVKACPYCGGVGKHALEDVLQNRVEDFARLNGWLVFHINDSRKQVRDRKTRRIVWVGDEDTKGWPDCTFVHPRRGVFLIRELKACRGRLTPSQKEVLDALMVAGVDAGVWRPKDHREIEATLSLTRR